LQPATIKVDYRKWRRAMLAAIREERRRNGQPLRDKGIVTRAYRAFELRMRRAQLKRLAGLA
jgi:hypothetical protein